MLALRIPGLPVALCAAAVLCSGCQQRKADTPLASQPQAGPHGAAASTGRAEEAGPGEPAAGPLRLRSVFWARKDGPRDEGYTVISDRVILSSGAEIGWKIELDRPARVCLIYRDAAGEVAVLFPDAAGPPLTAPGLHAPIPVGTTLDESTGIERFYLIASAAPVEPLESRISEYRAASGADRQRLKQPLLDALLDIRKRYEEVARAAGRPARIGGAVRHIGPENDAVEYEIHDVFCRMFTIDHR